MLKGLIGGFCQAALIGVLLLVPAGLVPAGTWYWHRALTFLGVYGCLVLAGVIILALTAPASLEARFIGPLSSKQPNADRIISIILVILLLAWPILIPLDVFYWKFFPPPPFSLSIVGVVLFLSGFAVMLTAICQNSFAAPIVENQAERGQVVIDKGLYTFVRHPMYLGMLPFFPGIALWLGSWVALLATPVLLIALIARIIVEESTLRKTLPGYADYMSKVPYRLVPLVW
jgi:protein-S-isoprenylcysteine O-methyltransferase Ste14